MSHYKNPHTKQYLFVRFGKLKGGAKFIHYAQCQKHATFLLECCREYGGINPNQMPGKAKYEQQRPTEADNTITE